MKKIYSFYGLVLLLFSLTINAGFFSEDASTSQGPLTNSSQVYPTALGVTRKKNMHTPIGRGSGQAPLLTRKSSNNQTSTQQSSQNQQSTSALSPAAKKPAAKQQPKKETPPAKTATLPKVTLPKTAQANSTTQAIIKPALVKPAENKPVAKKPEIAKPETAGAETVGAGAAKKSAEKAPSASQIASTEPSIVTPTVSLVKEVKPEPKKEEATVQALEEPKAKPEPKKEEIKEEAAGAAAQQAPEKGWSGDVLSLQSKSFPLVAQDEATKIIAESSSQGEATSKLIALNKEKRDKQQ